MDNLRFLFFLLLSQSEDFSFVGFNERSSWTIERNLEVKLLLSNTVVSECEVCFKSSLLADKVVFPF